MNKEGFLKTSIPAVSSRVHSCIQIITTIIIINLNHLFFSEYQLRASSTKTTFLTSLLGTIPEQDSQSIFTQM